MNRMTNKDFEKTITEATEALGRLNKLYRKTIGLVDSLKSRSIKYMNQVSNIEDGLENATDEDTFQKNIDALTRDIREFNSVISKRSKEFSQEIQLIMQMYQDACDEYKGEKGEMSDLLNARKRLLYLDVVIRKFRSKISSLQQMNNVLFSFSEELRSVRKEYSDNLIMINSELALSMEKCGETIKKIELIN